MENGDGLSVEKKGSQGYEPAAGKDAFIEIRARVGNCFGEGVKKSDRKGRFFQSQAKSELSRQLAVWSGL